MTKTLTMWPETHIEEVDAVYPIRLHDVEQLKSGDRICFLKARFNSAVFVAHDLYEGEVIERGRHIRLKLTAKNQFSISELLDDEELAVKPDTVTKIWAKRMSRLNETAAASFLPKQLPWAIYWKRLKPDEMPEEEYTLVTERYHFAQL